MSPSERGRLSWKTRRRHGLASSWNAGKHLSLKHKLAIGRASKEAWKSSEMREKFSAAMKGKEFTEIHKMNLGLALRKSKAHREAMHRINKDPEVGRKIREAHLGRKFSESHKKALSISLKYSPRAIAQRKKIRTCERPTKPEKRMMKILKRLKLRYKYEPPVAGFFPDFLIKKNGVKLIVEVDGSYWHSRPGSRKRDRKKSRLFRKLGYEVLRFSDKKIEFHRKRVSQAITAALG